MTPELTAAYASVERDLADQFEQLGLTDPQQRAQRHMRWLRDRGFRLHPALADGPLPKPTPAPPAVARKHLDGARAVVADVVKQLQAADTEEEAK